MWSDTGGNWYLQVTYWPSNGVMIYPVIKIIRIQLEDEWW